MNHQESGGTGAVENPAASVSCTQNQEQQRAAHPQSVDQMEHTAQMPNVGQISNVGQAPNAGQMQNNDQMAYGQRNLYQPVMRAREPKTFTARDSLFAVVMLVCGFMFIHLEIFFLGEKGMGVTLITAVFVAAAWSYMKGSGYGQTKESVFYLGLIGITAARFSLLSGGRIDGYSILLLMALTVYWIAVTTKRRISDEISGLSLGDLLNQLVCVPFSNFSCCFSGIGSGLGRTQKGRGIAGALLGLLIFAPVLIIVTGLLVTADAAFETWVVDFTESFFDNMFVRVLEVIFGIPVACYLFGLLYGNVKGRYAGRITKEGVMKSAKGFQFAPPSAIYACLGALCLIYMAFFAAQASYLFSAFDDQLPGSMTYAQYARRGFFELCTVAAINLGVISMAYLLLKRTSGGTIGAEAAERDAGTAIGSQGEVKALKAFTVLISLQTLVLLVTAVSKMVMYIGNYGLTSLRVYTTWFMAVLFILFCLLIVRQFKQFNLAKTAVAVTVTAFLVLSYSNVEGGIARYNIDRFEYGSLNSLGYYDVTAAVQRPLSDGAVAHVADLYERTENEPLKVQLEELLRQYEEQRYYRGISEGRLRSWNLQRARAYRRLEELLPPEGEPSESQQQVEERQGES